MEKLVIYTDGACSGNPGPGGYGIVLMYGEHIKEMNGGEKYTTNNRMELMGVIKALESLKKPCEVTLYTDSKYIVDAVNKKWAIGWKKNNWIKSDKKPALNSDLWEELLNLHNTHSVNYNWVKGHNNNKYNERCDELARKFIADMFF